MKRLTTVFFIIFIALKTSYAQVPQLWGMTSFGGPYNNGLIFKINSDGSNFDTIHTFYSYSGDGASPYGSLIQALDGYLYGATDYGGSYEILHGGIGTIFRINPNTNKETVIYNFNGNDGAYPDKLVQGKDGKLYGTALGGNDYSFGLNGNAGNSGDGVLFSFDPITLNYTALKKFKFNDTSGWFPSGSLIQLDDGELYGMTQSGGDLSQGFGGGGVIYSFDPINGIYKRLFDFRDSTGSIPFGSLMKASNGKLYGMTYTGGYDGIGVIFSFDISNDTYKDEHDFDGYDGGAEGSLIEGSDSMLYGMSSGGYDDNLNTNSGNIFRFDPKSNLYTNLYVVTNDTFGESPYGDLVKASNGKLYGMMGFGGNFSWDADRGDGVIFSFDLKDSLYTDMFNFNSLKSGAWPYGNLIEVDSPSNVLGIPQLSVNTNQFTLFPNPTSDQLTIISDQLPINKIEIKNVLGQAYLSESWGMILKNEETIDVSTLSAGMYFVTITTGNQTVTKKVIISR